MDSFIVFCYKIAHILFFDSDAVVSIDPADDVYQYDDDYDDEGKLLLFC